MVTVGRIGRERKFNAARRALLGNIDDFAYIKRGKLVDEWSRAGGERSIFNGLYLAFCLIDTQLDFLNPLFCVACFLMVILIPIWGSVIVIQVFFFVSNEISRAIDVTLDGIDLLLALAFDFLHIERVGFGYFTLEQHSMVTIHTEHHVVRDAANNVIPNIGDLLRVLIRHTEGKIEAAGLAQHYIKSGGHEIVELVSIDLAAGVVFVGGAAEDCLHEARQGTGGVCAIYTRERALST